MLPAEAYERPCQAKMSAHLWDLLLQLSGQKGLLQQIHQACSDRSSCLWASCFKNRTDKYQMSSPHFRSCFFPSYHHGSMDHLSCLATGKDHLTRVSISDCSAFRADKGLCLSFLYFSSTKAWLRGLVTQTAGEGQAGGWGVLSSRWWLLTTAMCFGRGGWGHL